MTSKESSLSTHLLPGLGIFGYENIEPAILASLVTADPLLLIGECGTGKTILLNNLSEALGLEHRHYNASLISFDDLVGFPYPAENFTQIKYLETPAAVWNAESVLIDEISRCKPEHQNRFFSLIQEKRIQGIKIEKLRYRWAAMNPCSGPDQKKNDSYEGVEPLDQALADRFAFIVEVPDWADLKDKAHKAIASPAGGRITAGAADEFKARLAKWQTGYKSFLENPDQRVVEYICIAASELGAAGLRISPRRVRQMVKNIGALQSVENNHSAERTFLFALKWSLPQRAWGAAVPEETIRAVHRIAWNSVTLSGRDKWLNDFHLERSLSGKAERLASDCPDADAGTLAVTQLLANEPKERASAFAYAVFPAALEGKLKIGKEGIADLSVLAGEVMDVDGEITWREHGSKSSSNHPEYQRFSRVLSGLSGKRRERAEQFFNYALVNNIAVPNPEALEEEFDKCISYLRSVNG